MKNLGTGDYSDSEKKYWKRMNEFYQEKSGTIKKSKSVIHVDFIKKKVIKGTTKLVKQSVNMKAA